MSALQKVKMFWESHVNNEYYTANERGTDSYFDEMALKRYRHHFHLPELFDRMARSGTGRLLEVGCGVALDSVELCRRGFGVTGIDLTQAGLRIAREYARRNQADISFAQGNAEKLPFADETFDHVYSFGVLHHTPAMRDAVAEIRRVLRPGGRAWVMIYARYSLVNAVHAILRLPYESPRNLRDHCPVVVRSSVAEAKNLFAQFQDIRASKTYPFTYGMRSIARCVPRRVERVLGMLIGWHVMIEARK